MLAGYAGVDTSREPRMTLRIPNMEVFRTIDYQQELSIAGSVKRAYGKLPKSEDDATEAPPVK